MTAPYSAAELDAAAKALHDRECASGMPLLAEPGEFGTVLGHEPDWRTIAIIALTAAADVRRQRDDDERVDCSACDGSGCEYGCGALADGCQDAYSGPDSHKVCPKCHGTGNAEPSAVGTQSSDTGEDDD